MAEAFGKRTVSPVQAQESPQVDVSASAAYEALAAAARSIGSEPALDTRSYLKGVKLSAQTGISRPKHGIGPKSTAGLIALAAAALRLLAVLLTQHPHQGL